MKKGFTLAEVLITMTIIGVIASLTIPSVISNTQQAEFKTGLRKAVSALNSAISVGMATEGISPKNLTKDYGLFQYLSKHMSIIKSTNDLSTYYHATRPNILASGIVITNKVFYTTDGMRYEFSSYKKNEDGNGATLKYKTYETDTWLNLCYGNAGETEDRCQNRTPWYTFACGSFGLDEKEVHEYTVNKIKKRGAASPCLIMVDVNGDRKPNPANVDCQESSCAQMYKTADPNGRRLTDIFSVMITDTSAIPYGVAAQRAMYHGFGKPKKVAEENQNGGSNKKDDESQNDT